MKHIKGKRILPFKICRTVKSPGFEYNPDTNSIIISGKSIPEDHKKVFNPILNWLDTFIENPPDNTILISKLQYFNSASSRYFMKILKKLEVIQAAGKKVEIHWVYEEDDLDMHDCGLDYKEIVDVPFTLIKVKELL